MIWYDMIWYKLQVQQFNHTFAIYLGQRVHEHLPAGIHGGGRGFQWSCDSLTARATEKMRLLQLWVNIWFISILQLLRRRKRTQVFAKLCPWVIDLCVILASLFSTYSLTYKVPCHLYIWCKCMQNNSTCTAFWFWLTDHVACESIQTLKNEKCRKNKVLAHERVFQNK